VYETAFRDGGELTLDEAVAYALGHRTTAGHHASPVEDEPRLTRREREVTELVAQGLGNRQIADRLVISQRTVESHVENVLTKLGFRSRNQIAMWQAQQRDRSG
jgi:non-specific serine/threonine protein kinase